MENIKLKDILTNPTFDRQSSKYLKTNESLINKVMFSVVVVLGLYYLNQLLFSITHQGLFLITALMLSVSIGLGVILKGWEVFSLIEAKKLKKYQEEFFQSIVKKAVLNQDYNNLNKILMSKQGTSYILELGYFINMYHNGEWIKKDQIEYPQEWGEDFFELMSKFFKEERSRLSCEKKYLDYDILDDWLFISTFLSTVKPKIMQEIVDKLED